MNETYFPPEDSVDFERIFSIEMEGPVAHGRVGHLLLRPHKENPWPPAEILGNTDANRQHKIRLTKESDGVQSSIRFSVVGDRLEPYDVLAKLREANVIASDPAEWRDIALQAIRPKSSPGALNGTTAKWTSYANADFNSPLASAQFVSEPNSSARQTPSGVLTFWSDNAKEGEMTMMLGTLKDAAETLDPAGRRDLPKTPVWKFMPGEKKMVEIRDGGKVVGEKSQYTIRFEGNPSRILAQEDLLAFLIDQKLAGAWMPTDKLASPAFSRGPAH